MNGSLPSGPTGGPAGQIAPRRVVTFGLVAQGRIAVGIIAMGGVSIGVIALGGISIGVVALGGLSVGVFALGGIALGWRAIGALTFGVVAAAGAIRWGLALAATCLGPDAFARIDRCRQRMSPSSLSAPEQASKRGFGATRQ